MKISPFALAGALILGNVAARNSHAAPLMQTLPVAPSYLAYVGSDDLDTLDSAHPNVRRDALGTPMSLLFNGTPRLESEKKNGYATLFATWAQTTLRVPLGWYAVDSRENVEESLVYSPGQTVQIVARAPIENHIYQSDREAFEKFKARSVEATRARLQKMGFRPGPIERFDLPGEAFAVRVARMLDRDGEAFCYIERFAQRTPQDERDEYWAAYNTGQPVANLQLPLALSLRTTPAKLDKYLPLLGLMARDAGRNWTTGDSLSLEAFRAKVPGAAQFERVADEAVALIRAGDAEAFQARFPTAFEGEDKARTADYLTRIAKPFFDKLPASIERQGVTLTRDRDPQTPTRVTIRRDYKISEENFPSYIVAMERANGKIELLGVATTDDPFAL